MPDLSQYSDEELMKIAGMKKQATAPSQDLSAYSDEELMKIVRSPQEPSLGQKIYQGVVSPTVEGLGLLGGGAGGLALGGPFGAIVGAGGGYTAARSLTKAGDVLLGYSKPETPV